MELLDGFRAWLKTEFECPVILEPQTLDKPEPRWRLVVRVFSPQGSGRRTLNLTGEIRADGNGPGIFLDKLLALSEKTVAMEITEKSFEFPYTMPGGTYTAKASFSLTAEGMWQENEDREKWPFSWVEQYKISLSYNPDNT